MLSSSNSLRLIPKIRANNRYVSHKGFSLLNNWSSSELFVWAT